MQYPREEVAPFWLRSALPVGANFGWPAQNYPLAVPTEPTPPPTPHLGLFAGAFGPQSSPGPDRASVGILGPQFTQPLSTSPPDAAGPRWGRPMPLNPYSGPLARFPFDPQSPAIPFGIGMPQHAGIPLEGLVADQLAPINRANKNAALSALRLVMPHIADPDFWKPPGPPSLTPTPDGKLPPADSDPRYDGVLGDLTNVGMALFPVGGPGRTAAELGIEGVSAALRRLLGMTPAPSSGRAASTAPGAVAEAKTAGMFAPPPKPARWFSEDYPSKLPVDASGRLVADIEGRPLTAKYISGRRMAGAKDQALTDTEIYQLIEDAIGTPPIEQTHQTMHERGGAYLPPYDRKGRVFYDEQGNPERPEMWINRELIAQQRPLVVAHETGHMIEELAAGPRGMPIRGLEPELERVYSTLNSGQEGRQPPLLPKDRGYRKSDAPSELVAEAVRAYLTDPNYFKTVAPNAAAAIRSLVNSHPELSKLIQFNALGGAAVLGAPDGNSGQ
jgi:hypothetical protein